MCRQQWVHGAHLVGLNYQHWLVRAETGYLIHPSVPLPGDQARVADIGSGTWYRSSIHPIHSSIWKKPRRTNDAQSNPTCSIWAIDLSKRLPASAKIHAFDVSPTLYPPLEWLPSNVSLHVHDAFTAFPEEIRGTYDVVHLRFFVTVVKDNDPGILLANIVQLLSERISTSDPNHCFPNFSIALETYSLTEPGGYLQWVEANPLAAMVVKARPSIDASAVMNMQKFLARPRVDATYR